MRETPQSLPAAFLERLQRLMPPDRWDVVRATFDAPKPTTFRVNTLKAAPAEVHAELSATGFVLEAVPWYPDARLIRHGALRHLQETPAYREGRIYVQSLSSMLPPLALDPQPGESVLDLTAAPGGKTTQLACLMRGQGRLVANDNNRVRFFKLRANVLQQGVPDIELSLRPGEAFGRHRPDTFDRVLLDAPCSTEGRFCAADPKSYGYWTPRKIHEMAGKQRSLLRAAAQSARPGGRVVYSTCTFAPEENEAVVDWVLQSGGIPMELEAVTVPVPSAMPGLTAWEDASYQPALSRTVRVLPTAELEGFFIASLRKTQ